MPIADAATPAPTYGHVRELEQPLDRAVLAVRAVQDGEDHVDVQAGHERFGGLRALLPRALDRKDGFVAGPRDEVDLAARR